MKATLRRNGREEVLEARLVVPGDIAIVEESQTIPADGKVCTSGHCNPFIQF